MASSCSFILEQNYVGPVCGLDEAGRGPLAGPVTAACVFIPNEKRHEKFWLDVTDSKKLTAKRRDALFDLIIANSFYGIAESTVEEIDKINILQASLQAMARSYDLMIRNFAVEPLAALVDGNQKPRLPCQIQTVIKGDSSSISIAAASILAKVTRDRVMADLSARHPGYGWSTNAGYGTAKHMEAIKQYGVTDHHRRSFAPVRSALTG